MKKEKRLNESDLSECCLAPTAIEGDENWVDGINYGTHYAVCSVCGEPCDFHYDSAV